MIELFGYKIETEVKKEKGSAIVESYTFFSKAQTPSKTWVELHMGIKGAALKDFVIAFEDDIDINNSEALKKLAQELTDEYADSVASELIDLLPDEEGEI